MRIRLPMQGWLAASHLVAVALPLAAVLATGALAADLVSQTRQDVEHQAFLVAELTSTLLAANRRDDPDATLDAVGERLSDRLAAVKQETLAGFEVVDAGGRVVASSGAAIGEDLGDQPEVREALAGRTGEVVRPRGRDRPLPPLGSESRRSNVRIFVAVPVTLGDELVGAVVVSRTPREELQTLFQMLPSGLWLAAMAAVGGAVALALGAGGVVTRSLRGIASESKAIADGTLEQARLDGPRASHVEEVAEVAAAIAALVERLQAKVGYIAEFAGNVSHEVRTPLTTLRGTLELLDDDPDMAPEQRRRFLDNARAEVDRLERLVAGLLALARVEEAAPQRDPVDLDALLAEVARRRGAQLSGRAGTIVGNGDQVRAVAENLVENALRHGGSAPRIAAFPAGFEVEDDGPGISAANLPKIFDRFFTTDRVSGTGLGLALVQAIARAHGGAIQVESRPGKTTFRVTFPS
jgi:signal transduction histidine kinase